MGLPRTFKLVFASTGCPVTLVSGCQREVHLSSWKVHAGHERALEGERLSEWHCLRWIACAAILAEHESDKKRAEARVRRMVGVAPKRRSTLLSSE